MPSALLRSAPSWNVVVRIESAAGAMIAAPRPCAARAAISAVSLDASPQRSEASVNVGDRVCGDHPLQILAREVKVRPDRRQRHVDDRDVEHGHEHRRADQRQHLPAARVGFYLSHRSSPSTDIR
jgi:hypothetical protein